MALPGMIRTKRFARMTVLAVVLVAAALPFASSPAAAASALRVAIIVGPVGGELTPQYIELAEMAAAEAEQAGAKVVRAYSPKATPRRVLRAVEGANIVIYFGHGTGFPNPYSQHPEAGGRKRLGAAGASRTRDPRGRPRQGPAHVLRRGLAGCQRPPGTGIRDDLLERLLRARGIRRMAAEAGPVRGADPRRQLLARRLRDGRVRLLRHRLLRRGRQARCMRSSTGQAERLPMCSARSHSSGRER